MVNQTNELRAMGIGPVEQRRRVAAGSLVRLRRGAYGEPAQLDEREAHRRLVWATLPQLDPGVVLSHTTAAVLHDFPVERRLLDRVWITRTSGGGGHVDSRLHEYKTPLPESDVVVVAGARVTTPARTVADVARTLPALDAVALVDAALRAGLTLEELTDQLAAAPRRRGVAKARALVAFGNRASESPGESRSRYLIWRLGLPAPVLQYEVFAGGRWFRSDFAWPESRLLGEFDGRIKYTELVQPGQTAADVITAEKHREMLLRREGWWVVRWGWAELRQPHQLRALIESGLRRAA